MIHTPMTEEEALKILNIQVEEDIEIEEKVDVIMKSYVNLHLKNEASKGGSSYI